jgi:hypothetical protein
MGGECSTLGEMRYAYKILVGISEGNRRLGRLSCGCKDDIEMSITEV